MPHKASEKTEENTSHLDHVPGTEILFDNLSHQPNLTCHQYQLKYRAKGRARLLLVPQPSSNNPNDPLRWSRRKKVVVFFNGCWFAFMGAVTGPIMAAGMIQLSSTFNKTPQQITYANGACLINQGVWNCIWMPFAVKYGRRPVYLASNFLMGIACIWLALASTGNWTAFLVGRAFLGAFQAPVESIVPSTVTDMFFLHHRGGLVAIYGLAGLGGNELGPMFSGLIVQSLGIQWAFWIVAMFIGASFVCMFFFMPETKFTGSRPRLSASSSNICADTNKRDERFVEEQPTCIPQKTWLEELTFWNHGDPNVNLLHTFLRPFILLYPTVTWSCLIYGLALSWNVILGAVVAQLFAPAPYTFNSEAQGLFFLSPFIGSLVGVYLSGPGSDWIANVLTKRNKGIREPEMRLPTCAVAALVTFLGALWFALSYQRRMHWAMPVVGAGVLSIGSQMGTTLGINYALDCHEEFSVEIIVTIAALKSAIAWIWTWVINDFIAACGVITVFMTVAAINVAIYLLCIPFYYRGKSMRVWLHRRNPAKSWLP